eukprot:Selendium_serpulae@DN5246_c0_g1_i1.p1
MPPRLRVEFFYDIGSMYSYFAFVSIRKHKANVWKDLVDVVYKPALVGGIFKHTGNAAPAAVPVKAVYVHADSYRIAKLLGLNIHIPDFFPASSLKVMRVLHAVKELRPSELERASLALFEAYWTRDQNISETDVLESILRERYSHDEAKKILEAAESASVKQALMATTKEAVENGAFGAPTFVIPSTSVLDGWPKSETGREMFFGYDRLFLLAKMTGLPFQDAPGLTQTQGSKL